MKATSFSSSISANLGNSGNSIANPFTCTIHVFTYSGTPLNMDTTNGAEESVIVSEVSSFQRLRE